MEYIREVKIIINDEKFDNINEAFNELQLLAKDDNYGNNIEIYIDTNKTTYEKEFTAAESAIDFMQSIFMWIGK